MLGERELGGLWQGDVGAAGKGRLSPAEDALDRSVRLPFSQPAARLDEAVDRLAEAWDALPNAVPSRRRPAPALVT